MKRKIFMGTCLCIFLACGSVLSAREFKVAITQTPTSDVFTTFIKAIAEASGNTVAVQVVPRARAVYLIESELVDIQLPSIRSTDPAALNALKYAYSSVSYMKSCYVLYSIKNKAISVDELKSGNPKKLKIETDSSLINSFGFTASPSTNLEGSLKKVNDGIVDGYIYSQASTDVSLRKLGLSNIRRQLFSYVELCFAIRKGPGGAETDKMLTDGTAKIRANGTFDKIMATSVKNGLYDDWQPYA
jgi:polar amino acid transport system substrate-binding protein